MTEKKDEYPVASLHQFLEEASREFRRFRFQAKVNLIGSIILLLLLSRFLLFALAHFGPQPFVHEQPYGQGLPPPMPPPRPFLPDFFLLIAALAAVLWSLYVWIKQRKFVSRWGDRFEKLDALEKRLLPDEDT
jgi:hypothetical protein